MDVADDGYERPMMAANDGYERPMDVADDDGYVQAVSYPPSGTTRGPMERSATVDSNTSFTNV